MTQLIKAAQRGDIARVRKLLDADADVNAVGQEGWTALVWSASCGNCELVRILLAHRAKPNLRDRWKRTALFYAAVGPTVEDPKEYRTKMKDLDAKETVAILLANGADATLKDEVGYTALTWAEHYRKSPSFGTLFSASADEERRQQLDTIIRMIESVMTKKEIIH